jgi:hypothetical protein
MVPLPDLFRFDDGATVRTAEDWRRRRAELLTHLLDIAYGPLPPAPPRVEPEKLNSHNVRRLGGVRHSQYRLRAGQARWVLDVLFPTGAGPWPVVLTGDGCWLYVTDAVRQEAIRRGYILAQFNRTEIVPDQPAPGRHGAIAAWAWGYHCCVDFLSTLPEADAGRIAIVGHSRGGKTTLLAGATDERIAVVGANASGCGGSAPFRSPPPEAETLAIITERFPHWFSPRLREFAGREPQLPFDQHALIAAVAPRAFLNTLALGDLWANPAGSFRAYRAAREVWRFLGAPDKIGIAFREGVHEHNQQDWLTFLDFADWHLRGVRPTTRFHVESFEGKPTR